MVLSATTTRGLGTARRGSGCPRVALRPPATATQWSSTSNGDEWYSSVDGLILKEETSRIPGNGTDRRGLTSLQLLRPCPDTDIPAPTMGPREGYCFSAGGTARTNWGTPGSTRTRPVYRPLAPDAVAPSGLPPLPGSSHLGWACPFRWSSPTCRPTRSSPWHSECPGRIG